MADGRFPQTGGFPGYPSNHQSQQQLSHGGFTPSMQQYQMMPQHQHGMMPMQQGVMNQQFIMQQGMHQHMYPGMQGQMNYVPQPQQAFRSQGYMAPPAYTHQMAHNFQSRQSVGKPAKNVEEEIKKRHFQDTQRRLMQVGRSGQKIGDANSMIDAILGKNQPKTAPKIQVEAAKSKQNDVEDNFGDFIQGPTENQTKPVTQAPQENLNQQTVDVSKPAEKPEPKIGIEDMMKACSDLTESHKKARTFQKPTVSQIQPKHHRTTSFRQSTQARKWTGDGEDLDNLFVLPQPEPVLQEVNPAPQSSQIDSSVADTASIPAHVPSAAPTPSSTHHQPSHIPPIFYHDTKIPPIYHQVLEASWRDGAIDTGVVYSILIRSNLPRELLGYIWGIANKTQPGRLIKEELYMVLALIALAQGKQDVSSLAIFNVYPEPLVPFLGQHIAQVPPASTSANVVPPSNTITSSTANGAEVMSQDVSNDNVQDSFGDFVSSPADFKTKNKGTENDEKSNHFTFQSSSKPAGAMTKPPVNVRPTAIHDDIGSFSKITELANKVTESATILPSPNNNNTSVPFSPSNFIGLMAEIATKSPRSLDGSSIGSFKMDLISQKSLPSSYAIDDDDDFDEFKSAESSDNLSGSFANFTSKISTDQSNVDSNEKYSAFRTVGSEQGGIENKQDSKAESLVYKGVEEPVINSVDQNNEISAPKSSATKECSNSNMLVDKYSAFKDQISALYASKDSAPAISTDITNSESTDTSQSWDAFSHSADTTEEPSSSSGFADFSQFHSADDNGNKTEGNNLESSDHNFGKKNEGADHKTWTETIEKDNSENLSTPSNPFGAVGTFSSKRGLQNGKSKSPENTFIELADGTLREAPPELTFNDEDEEFSDFMSSGTTPAVTAADDSELFTDTRSGVIASDWMAGSRAPKSLRPKALNSYQSSDPTKAKSGLFSDPKDDTNIPATLPINQAIITDILEDSQSVSSLEFSKKDSSKDLNSLAGDNQSISSFNSADSGKKSNPDQASVKSLDLKATFYQSPAETPGSNENFGSFCSAEPSQNNIEDSWNQCPRDASDLLSDNVFLDRYSSARNDVMNVERHAFEWERSLKKCLDIIQKASDVFNSISSSSVCNEVIKSRQGSDYILGIVEIYRVVKRLSLAMKVSAVTNENLHNLVCDIEVSWSNVAAFIQNSSLMPDVMSLDFSKCILRCDDEDMQHQACGVCLLNVDTRSKAFDREMDKHKLRYGGRQYHVTCANFWINCVDSTLPTLRLPELL